VRLARGMPLASAVAGRLARAGTARRVRTELLAGTGRCCP
jgi:hypothetical protein